MVVSYMANNHAKRDRHDILAEILETAKDGAIKTHIMYKARLSYKQLDTYTTLLVEKGYLEKRTTIKERRKKLIYKTSQLGQQYIKNLKTFNL